MNNTYDSSGDTIQMDDTALQEYISALVDEQKAGLCGCERMYLHFQVQEKPHLKDLFRQIVAVKLILSRSSISAPCPSRVAQQIHRDIRRLYIHRYHTLAQ